MSLRCYDESRPCECEFESPNYTKSLVVASVDKFRLAVHAFGDSPLGSLVVPNIRNGTLAP